MRRVFLVLCFAVAMIGTLATAETRYVYSPGDGYLNLRTGPSTRNKIIKPMYNGQRVWVISRSGNWRQVRHESGTVGWAYKSYLVSKPVAGGGSYYVNSPGDGYLNLRAGPSASSRIIRRMQHGSAVRVTGSKGSWLSIVHDSGARGWAHHKYFSSTRPPAYRTRASRKDCSNIDTSATGWYIRMYKCGDKSLAEYPGCLAKWKRKLCDTNSDPAGFLNLLLNERG